MSVDREIGEQQERPECTAFPKAKRNNTFLGAFRRNPLDEEPRAENSCAEPPEDFPWRNRESINLQLPEKTKTVHIGGTLRQIIRPEQLFPADKEVSLSELECSPSRKPKHRQNFGDDLAFSPEDVGCLGAAVSTCSVHQENSV